MWLLGIFFTAAAVQATLYDAFTGKPATKEQLRRYRKNNNTFFCVTDVKACDRDEYRHLDGSCNNLKNPPRGAVHTPSYRVLKPVYGEGYTNRKTKSQQDLKNPRYVRQQALLTGKASSGKFTQLSLFFLLFIFNDFGSLDDIQNYINDRPYCCMEKGKKDDMCTPNLIQNDDPVHRFTNIRCMNMTRPLTFQYHKCLLNDITPERIMPSTPLFDLSQIYNLVPDAISKLRTYSGGKMRSEDVNGHEYPPGSDADPIKRIPCKLNRKPRETRCHAYRKENMIRDGLISCDKGFRDIYREDVLPQMSDEFPYMLRWFHIAQENSVHMYDKEGHYLRSFPMVNLTTQTGFLAMDDIEGQILRGSYRQPTGEFFDYAVDPDLADVGLGGLQQVFDITMADLAKGRLFGFAPFKDYREFCAKKKYAKWDDYSDTISQERIYRMRIIYKDMEDVELMLGTWLEDPVEGGHIPPTLYCLLADQLLRSIKSDRYWYERKDRPHAFTYAQLQEIRNANMAYFLCLVGEVVDRIQPRPFETCGPKNKYVTCDKFKELDLSAWREC